jgi:hypothetical protein
MEEKFFDKVKAGFGKFVSGVKSFVVKTGRVNSTNNYGCIDGIGDLIVYEDHALISAVGMDDVVIKKENVVSYSFNGLGNIRKKRATVSYKLVLDDNVVFPEKVRERHDVKNLTATIFADKERNKLLGTGGIEYTKGKLGQVPLTNCDIYAYETCFIFAVKLERMNGDKVEKYEESILYPYTDIAAIAEKENGKVVINFKEERLMSFVPKDEKARTLVETLKAKI